ncbi:MAG: hypothetical protein ACI841_002744 [Planctomycetota bacterium]|jgi:hypothetical protein
MKCTFCCGKRMAQPCCPIGRRWDSKSELLTGGGELIGDRLNRSGLCELSSPAAYVVSFGNFEAFRAIEEKVVHVVTSRYSEVDFAAVPE